ncbi:MlaD family protein [Nocardioides ferulae]|uniref:MlaD family protein n=1 Tax=Nocardioides ferulae TaxID=2340821 RepID=UPI000EAC5F92|nr:MlaD family protein [Nocardioides ferulae]
MNHRTLARRAKLAQALLLAILAAGTVYVADSVVGGQLFTDPYRVTVHFDEAAGLHERSTVNYRGQQVGTVSDVRLTADGVVAELTLEEGVEVPRDSEVGVANLSAVGEQYVDIRPRTAEGPMLEDGDVVTAEDTTTPPPVHEVVAHTQRLMRRVDLADVRTIGREVARAFADGSVDLRATSVELERSVALLQRLQPDLLALLEHGEVPLRTGVEKEQTIRRASRDLAAVAAELRRADRPLRRLIDDGGRLVPLLQRLWATHAPTLRSLLETATPLAEMSAAHLPGLRVWLDWIPEQLEAMARSTRDGSGWVVLVPKLLENCTYSGPSGQRDPSALSRRPPPVENQCTEQRPGIQARGSQNVPRP